MQDDNQENVSLSSEDVQEIIEFNRIAAEKTQMEAEAIYVKTNLDALQELREWLCSGEYTGENHVLGEGQVIKPILTEESVLKAAIFKKAEEIIDRL